MLLAFDFGDAPEPYPTILDMDGARHEDTGPMLGASRTSDDDGTPSVDANGEGAEEDGVVFGSLRVGQLDATVAVDVQGESGRLDAWIDFNRDGSWGGPFEHILRGVDVSVGTRTHTFSVPSWAVDGMTYARFRLSTGGFLGVAGEAADGEVEDYQLTIGPPVRASGNFPTGEVIATAPDIDDPTSVFAADVDGDGLMDVVATSHGNDKIAWYKNDGDKTFTTHDVDVDTTNGPSSVFVVDVDGDGDADVLSASRNDNDVTWFENDGSQTFSADTIYNNAANAAGVFAADMDGDGDLDVLSAAGGTDDEIAWYENDGSQSFAYHSISQTAEDATSVFAADVDGDGDMDVLSASEDDDTIAWFENGGAQIFTRHNITIDANGASSVFAIDVDDDGDLDVLSASYNDDTIAWYENNGDALFSNHHEITTSADGANSVFATDMDGDGDVDVLSASERDNTIAWYENDGSQNFTPHVVSTAADKAYSVFAADVDGDGDMDVISASQGDHTIAWYENEDLPSWQNPDDPFDVDGIDGPVPLDILILVSYLNSDPDNHVLPAPPEMPPPFYDVNDDGWCTTLDVLLVLNELNENARVSAEGEAPPDMLSLRAVENGCDWLNLGRPERGKILPVAGREMPHGWKTEPAARPRESAEHRKNVFDHLGEEQTRNDVDATFDEFDLWLSDIVEDVAETWR